MERRLLGAGVALGALALAACSHSSNSTPPVVTTTSTPTPTATITSTANSTPAPGTAGLAYIPDAGVAGFSGMQVVHVEDLAGNLLPTPHPMQVPFASSAGLFSVSGDGTVAMSVLKNSSGGYSLIQAVNGVNVGSIVPVGSTYDASMYPPAQPSSSPSPNATATPIPSPLPEIADISGASILGSGTNSVGLLIGPGTQGFLGVTSLADAPPLYGGFAPFQGSTQKVALDGSPRTNIDVLLDLSGNYGAILRGPNDLVALTISLVGSGYQFQVTADDTSLGYGNGSSTWRGYGGMALDPADATRAVVVRTTGGGTSTVTLVTGLPSALTHSSTVTLTGTLNTVTISPNGLYAVVGGTNGFYVLGGVGSGSLNQVAVQPASYASVADSNAYSPAFTACDGSSARLVNVTSAGFTSDDKYLVVLGSSGKTCSSGGNSTVVALPFNIGTGVVATPSPAPSTSATTPPAQFNQNNIVTPPTNADIMAVH